MFIALFVLIINPKKWLLLSRSLTLVLGISLLRNSFTCPIAATNNVSGIV
jgi:hypothetical protein